jgi:hypothetical protein
VQSTAREIKFRQTRAFISSFPLHLREDTPYPHTLVSARWVVAFHPAVRFLTLALHPATFRVLKSNC